MYIILAVIGFGILIFVHELGHFLAARACGVKVLEFAMGMGPTLLKKQGRETLYSLHLLPIGGFCAMEGEDEESDDPASFSGAAPWKRFIILIAGVTMNFFIGFVMVIVVYAFAAGFVTPVISGFMDGCPYESADMFQTGDEIYSIDGHRTWFYTDVTTYLSQGGDEYDIVVIRDGEKLSLGSVEMTPVDYPTADGGTEQKYGFYFTTVENSVWNTVKYSWYSTLNFVRVVWWSLGQLVTGGVALSDMSGVVGVVDVANSVGESAATVADGVLDVTYLFALIAVNLAVMNLLPIPALDGGQILLLIITQIFERLTGKKLDPKYASWLNNGCFALLMAFMVLILGNDIWRIVSR
ncbi:MAG: site-2 protease family protein [Oscillospiraceae bacterium]|nr:site-2 protease family protein [Oscillospiraceae bacterium]